MPSPKKKPSKKGKHIAAQQSATKKPSKQKIKTSSPAPGSKPLLRSAAAAPEDNTALDTIYVLDDLTNNITLTVKVGDKGQTSDMTVKLDQQIIVQNHAGDLAETILGPNEQLNGKQLRLVATIADTSRETDITSLTIQLKGGLDVAEYHLLKKVTEEGASVDYLCLIEFFKP